MAQIDADANDVITLLTEKIGTVEKENAILLARLHTANRMIDEAAETVQAADPDVAVPAGLGEKKSAARR